MFPCWKKIPFRREQPLLELAARPSQGGKASLEGDKCWYQLNSIQVESRRSQCKVEIVGLTCHLSPARWTLITTEDSMHFTDKEVGKDRVYWVLTMYRREREQHQGRGAAAIVLFGLAWFQTKCGNRWCNSYRNSSNSTQVS